MEEGVDDPDAEGDSVGGVDGGERSSRVRCWVYRPARAWSVETVEEEKLFRQLDSQRPHESVDRLYALFAAIATNSFSPGSKVATCDSSRSSRADIPPLCRLSRARLSIRRRVGVQ